jgi:hypothetical protein
MYMAIKPLKTVKGGEMGIRKGVTLIKVCYVLYVNITKKPFIH